MVPNGKVKNTNFVTLIKFYIWSNGQLFIWKSLNHSILNFERIHSHSPVFRTVGCLDWERHEYQYCSTHQDTHLICRPFLYLTKCWEGVVENPQFSHIVSYSLCEIQDLVGIVYVNFLKWKKCLYKKFGSLWSLTSWNSNFFHLKSSNGSFDQVWPKLVLDFKHMCIRLAQIYPWKNGQYIKCISWWSLTTLY